MTKARNKANLEHLQNKEYHRMKQAAEKKRTMSYIPFHLLAVRTPKPSPAPGAPRPLESRLQSQSQRAPEAKPARPRSQSQRGRGARASEAAEPEPARPQSPGRSRHRSLPRPACSGTSLTGKGGRVTVQRNCTPRRPRQQRLEMVPRLGRPLWLARLSPESDKEEGGNCGAEVGHTTPSFGKIPKRWYATFPLQHVSPLLTI
ncbi:uncharacterized protein LOC120510837 [Passer montanus]|uniref:uncharacterized protein LOC120510837 n=1 Tax=Passer montanus TaxID=9160 RepID=UPI00195F3388|nr:uncharacterized protein LOC120510837 [Passer montanus]